jgi:hydroxypyruvate reductase
MARAAASATQVAILISDVPEGKLDSLASGPTMPDSTTVDECYRVAEKYGLVQHFPPPVADLFKSRGLEETPKPGDPEFTNSRWCVISSNNTAVNATVQKARAAGFKTVIDNRCDDWDYAAAADYLLGRLRELREGSGERVCIVSGGEVTVKVTNGGVGGRNQQFALYCATKIPDQNIAVLSGGTDGIDGNSDFAGAVVDGTTVQRAVALGKQPEEALRRFDATPLFARTDDAIITGPTGNNVRDLRILIAW